MRHHLFRNTFGLNDGGNDFLTATAARSPFDDNLLFTAIITLTEMMRITHLLRRHLGNQLLCVHMNVRMGMGHRYAVRTMLASFYVQRIVPRELAAQNKLERRWNFNINRWRYWYQRRCRLLIFPIFCIAACTQYVSWKQKHKLC